jgi:hypothetical protein
VNDIWSWTINNFAPKARVQKWYNDEIVSGMGGFFSDYTSRIIGYAVLRTNRVKNNSCKLSSQVQNITSFCIQPYSVFDEEKGKYGFNWTDYNSSYTPDIGMERIYNAFQYRHSDDLPMYTDYGEGGFTYEMRGRLSFIQGNMSVLQQMDWIDRQTRSVFIEFTLYNPNLNLFSVSYILFEILPSGNILKTPRFNVLSLFSTKFDAVEIGTGVAYLAIIVYFMVREIFKIFKFKKAYFRQIWSYVQWAIIGFSWAALAMYIYKLHAGQKVKDFFKETNGYGYIKLTKVSYWNDMLTFTIGMCTCLATVRFIKLLRFNSNIHALILAIRTCLNELVGISFMVIIFFAAFSQVFYGLFNERILGFSTLLKSTTTCFQILLGKFQVGPILSASFILGPLFFSFFNVLVLFITISVFITIISDNFLEVKKNSEAYFIKTQLNKYVVKKMRSWGKKIGLVKKKVENHDDLNSYSNQYVSETDLLSNRLGKLFLKVNEVSALNTLRLEKNLFARKRIFSQKLNFYSDLNIFYLSSKERNLCTILF